jgi:hypothetical protein
MEPRSSRDGAESSPSSRHATTGAGGEHVTGWWAKGELVREESRARGAQAVAADAGAEEGSAAGAEEDAAAAAGADAEAEEGEASEAEVRAAEEAMAEAIAAAVATAMEPAPRGAAERRARKRCV